MSLYHLIEKLPDADLEELGELYAGLGFTDLAEQVEELVDARSRTLNAVWDQQYRTSADAEAMDAGARQDRLTEELADELQRLFPGIRTLGLAPVRSAA